MQLRPFRNTDPPGLVEIWNDALRGRGSVQLRYSTPLEACVFSKPYFDPLGLWIALDGGQPVGFAHAGFGCDATQSDLDHTRGVVCAIAVRPAHQGQGIGTALLAECEAYLRRRGATELYAGPIGNLGPFYLGIYGGSNLPGFLASDPNADGFLRKRNYEVGRTTVILQRQLGSVVDVVDGRFASLRKRCEVKMMPAVGPHTWWEEGTWSGIEHLAEFRLEDKSNGAVLARVLAWEMEGFSWKWNQPTVGILDVRVAAELRRQGLAKFLLYQVLRYLQEQHYAVAEVHVDATDAPAIQLFTAMGMKELDRGYQYRKLP